jgi:hypothetical protein
LISFVNSAELAILCIVLRTSADTFYVSNYRSPFWYDEMDDVGIGDNDFLAIRLLSLLVLLLQHSGFFSVYKAKVLRGSARSDSCLPTSFMPRA